MVAPHESLRLAAPPPGLLLLLLLQMCGGSSAANFCDPHAGPHALPSAELEPTQLRDALTSVAVAVCDHLGSNPPKRRVSEGRWTAEVDLALGPSLQRMRAVLAEQTTNVMGQRAWKTMEDWLQAVAGESEAFEIQALIAPIQEKRWFALIDRYGAFGIVSPKPDRGPGPGGSKWCLLSGCSHDQISQVAIENWKRSGRVEDAQRFFQHMWSYEEGTGSGVFPYRYMYDTADVRHVSALPVPGLRKLTWPEPRTLLPEGVADELLSNLPSIAEEAGRATGLLEDQEDAYPNIAGKSQWNKLMIYKATKGWDEELCARVPIICSLLKGKMLTEQEPAHSLYQSGMFPDGDEAVILFRVAAGGMAHLHTGQDARINVHFCVLNCGQSQVSVAGSVRNYSDGSLFAFEDRADHEIINNSPDADRILLTIGVLHPDLAAQIEHEPYPSPQHIVRYAIDAPNATDAKPLHPKALVPALVLASYYGYAEAVKTILERTGSTGDDFDSGRTAPVHAACLGLNRPDAVGKIDEATRKKNALAVLEVLANHGANLAADGRDGTAQYICTRMGHADLSTRIGELQAQQKQTGKSNTRRGGKRGKRGGGGGGGGGKDKQKKSSAKKEEL